MNRWHGLDAWPETTTLAPAAALDLRQGRFAPLGDQPCACFAPLHYEPNYGYPLLVWLHGPQDDESQLKRIMPFVSLRNYVAVAPRGTSLASGPRGSTRATWRQSAADFALAEERVFQAIALASERLHVAPGRIFLAGYDTGGTMALRLAMAHPESFAGVLSICGEFPGGRGVLARLDDVRRLPIYLASARDSTSFPPERVCDHLRLCHAANLKLNLRQYPGQQELTTLMLADMDRWIMEQVTGVPVAAE